MYIDTISWTTLEVLPVERDGLWNPQTTLRVQSSLLCLTVSSFCSQTRSTESTISCIVLMLECRVLDIEDMGLSNRLNSGELRDT